MGSASQKPFYAIAVLALICLGYIAFDRSASIPALVFFLGGFIAVIVSSHGGGGDNISVARQALRKLADDKQLVPPNNASPDIRDFFESAEDFRLELAEQRKNSKDDRKQRLELKAQIDELEERLETTSRALLEAEKLKSNHALSPENLQDLDQVSRFIEELTRGAGEYLELGDRASSVINELTAAMVQISEHIEVLASSAEESSASIMQLTTTTDQMVNGVGELGSSVRESVSSIEEMTFSIKEVAKNVDALSLTAEETSSSMNEMDVSIDQVQSNANETARLSEEVARDAELGAESILKTIGEIYRIKESSQEAVSVMSDLGSRIDAIGQILNVIDEVAEQTNLLALNAAIIAAQAGEHGKGFAVVADEIKDLAERAGASTKEIADLIKTIQTESRNAITAVERGAQNVDRGVQVSNEAERALKKILESSQKSTNMVRAIARATVEQSKGSKQVTDAIGRIAETVQQIAAATAEQARGSEMIMNSGEKMRTIAQQVERSSEEQSRGGRQISQAIESISAMVHQLNSAYRQHARGSDTAVHIAQRLSEISKSQVDSAGALQGVISRVRTPKKSD